ncbi:MAG: heavy-metal-associated domain-containing protein [Campylobacterota bacterium]|nr:heavy-metal-associated domain-containing protein [Campylobacterota bacterium]
MKNPQTFIVHNVKCGGCANTLKKALLKEFGEVEVNLETVPRQITLNIQNNQLENLKTTLRNIGYPLSTDELGNLETLQTKAKSFVSCAIGKMS